MKPCFSQHLLSAYEMLDIVPGPGNIQTNKTIPVRK